MIFIRIWGKSTNNFANSLIIHYICTKIMIHYQLLIVNESLLIVNYYDSHY